MSLARILRAVTSHMRDKPSLNENDEKEESKPERGKGVKALPGKEELRLQRLISELSSRENSTLVFSTIAASASLAIIALLWESTMTEWFDLAFWMGLLFSLAGFLYREATILGIDIEDYKILNLSVPTLRERSNKRVRTLNFFRMFIIRLFLLIPIGTWILVRFLGQTTGWMVLTYITLGGIAFFFSLYEYDIKYDP